MSTTGEFHRRQNPDSTIDLICPRCFQTVGSGKSDSEALAAAKRHPSCERLEDTQQGFMNSNTTGLTAPE